MKRWLAALPLLLVLAGCAPHAREPEGLALVRVLGVDGGAGVTLTAVCHGQAGEEPLLGQVTAADFSAARQALPWCGKREMALTNLSYIIIGKDGDAAEVLRQVLNDREMSPSVTVWFAEDAAALLEACADPVGRLELLTAGGVNAPTVAEVLAALEGGGRAELPVLAERDGMLCAEGVREWTNERERGLEETSGTG